jgi:hypothetical protein
MRIRFFGTLSLLGLIAFSLNCRGVTMEELRSERGLTPLQFAHYFANFEFKFHPEVQPHNQFLRTRSGDCDDYATVAADALARHGWTPRMIAIRMKGATHVVCYIQELRGYLDYNMRKEQNPLVPCDPEITAIATSVAKSFGRNWVATYEFTYDEHQDMKRLVNRIIPNTGQKMEAQVLTAEQTRSGAAKK